MSNTFGTAQALWFASPHSHLNDPKQVLVHSDTRNGFASEFAGRIIDVKPTRTFTENHMWYTSTSGYYVDGVPILGSRDVGTYQSVIVLDYDVPFIGTVELSGEDYALVRESIRPDAKRTTSRRFPATKMIRPAEWAESLFPRDGEEDNLTSLRCEVASAKFRREYAEATIFYESYARGWDSDLEDLDYTMPKALWSAHVRGQLYVNTRREVSNLPDGNPLSEVEGVNPNPYVLVSVPAAAIATGIVEYEADKAKAQAVTTNTLTYSAVGNKLRSAGHVVESSSVDIAYPIITSLQQQR